MVIVGFSGKKGSGKSTLSQALARDFDGAVFSFADVLKEHCQELFGLTIKQCYGTEEHKNSPTKIRWWDMADFPSGSQRSATFMTAREVLQYYGTQIIRRINPNAWVDATMGRIDDMEGVYEHVFIQDVRYVNEVEAIQSRGGKVIRLTRHPYHADNHSSEIALDTYTGFDAILDNAVLSEQDSILAVRNLL